MGREGGSGRVSGTVTVMVGVTCLFTSNPVTEHLFTVTAQPCAAVHYSSFKHVQWGGQIFAFFANFEIPHVGIYRL